MITPAINIRVNEKGVFLSMASNEILAVIFSVLKWAVVICRVAKACVCLFFTYLFNIACLIFY